MSFEKGQIVKVALGDTHAFGRVTSVDQYGDGEVIFRNPANGHIISTTVLPEMVQEAFHFQGKGRYGV